MTLMPKAPIHLSTSVKNCSWGRYHSQHIGYITMREYGCCWGHQLSKSYDLKKLSRFGRFLYIHRKWLQGLHAPSLFRMSSITFSPERTLNQSLSDLHTSIDAIDATWVIINRCQKITISKNLTASLLSLKISGGWKLGSIAWGFGAGTYPRVLPEVLGEACWYTPEN